MNDQIKEKLLKAMEDKSSADWAGGYAALSPEDAAEVAMQFINQSQWRDISTAPIDGTRILVVDAKGNMTTVYWRNGWYLCEVSYYADYADLLFDPTHWQPLP